jgi:uncharacterized protein (DUF2384 family)
MQGVAPAAEQPAVDAGEPTATDAPRRPMRRQFVNKFKAPRLSAEEADRQGRVTLMAFRVLGGRDQAIEFLNTHDPVLDGRPLDLAVASPAGLEAVEQAITARAVRA